MATTRRNLNKRRLAAELLASELARLGRADLPYVLCFSDAGWAPAVARSGGAAPGAPRHTRQAGHGHRRTPALQPSPRPYGLGLGPTQPQRPRLGASRGAAP